MLLFLLFFVTSVWSQCSSNSKLAKIVNTQINAWNWDPTDVNALLYFSICGTLPQSCPQSSISNCAVCQTWGGSQNLGGACLGAAVSTVTETGNTIDILFTGGDTVPNSPPPGSRETHLLIRCDPSASALTPIQFQQAASQPLRANYDYVITVNYDCPGLSVGWILVIVLLGVILIYLAAGIAFNVLKNDKKGVEAIPNADFWKEAPWLAKDGAVFVWNKIMGALGKSEYQAI